MLSTHLPHAPPSSEPMERRTIGPSSWHRDANVISIVAGVVVFLLLTALMLGAPDDAAAAFFSLPMLAWIAIVPAAVLLIVYGWQGVASGIGHVWMARTPGRGAADASMMFQLWAAFSLVAGFLAATSGLVVMAAQVDVPGRLGRGMAMVLLGELYGAALAVILLALAATVHRRHQGPGTPDPMPRRAASAAALTVAAGAVTTLVAFGILLLSAGRAY